MSSIPTNNAPTGTSPALRVPITSPYLIRGNDGRLAHIMPTREVQRTLRLHPMASSPLTYHGGPVQTSPSVILILWGMSTTDPEAQILAHFFENVGGTGWQNIDHQYSESSSLCAANATGGTCVGNGTGQLTAAHVVVDTSSVPSRPSQSNVAAIAAKWANTYGTGPQINYFVAIAKGHDPSGFRTRWCAFHSTTGSGSSEVSYTDFPYTTDAGTSCGENYVNSGSAGLYDGVTIVGGHEYAETQTDPQPSSGWVDSSGSEIGDKCAWSSGNPPGSQDITVGGTSYAVQPLFSDANSDSCAISY
jgi:serine protease